ncbi:MULTISPECIES: helix-turn-helix transcriptional regulator [Idiomarina]|jgi:transcriptional regulator with XRE-family HTH domain|uniref:helix-turn-helix transcriptional regulator n=1 Tax=Idiomarina TaxID=135575 RepID=UPI000C44D090|nr:MULTISPECIES: helix-turn-helix transcriptional regulator [Idiomarina]MAO67069.1 transcriptional regulator [Idiomarina sp.]MBF80191.1 transcriptional regulator [Idiomarina sp.]|tara:strand:+ start:131 stop:463 length:333 start_codon:yes stop_codon:yes gene_type:complete
MQIDAAKAIELRNKRGWTQQHLADACAVSLRTIQRVEKDGIASQETVAALCSVYEIERQVIGADSVTKPKVSNAVNQQRPPGWLDALPMLITLLLGMAIGIGLTLWLTNR